MFYEFNLDHLCYTSAASFFLLHLFFILLFLVIHCFWRQQDAFAFKCTSWHSVQVVEGRSDFVFLLIAVYLLMQSVFVVSVEGFRVVSTQFLEFKVFPSISHLADDVSHFNIAFVHVHDDLVGPDWCAKIAPRWLDRLSLEAVEVLHCLVV